MNLLLPFRYVLDRPGGVVNLLLIAVCQFIPVVGPIVVLGYRGEVAAALNRDPALVRHPRFDFERFVEYLTRGLWPFLYALIIALVVIPVIVAGFVVPLLALPPGPNNPPFLALGIGAGVLLLSLGAFLIVSVPMTFHAELTARFDPGGALRFVFGFWSRVGLVAVGTGIVFVVLSGLIYTLGLLLFLVGLYPANALIQMAGVHLMVQLYGLYLDRGGEPLLPEDGDDDPEAEAGTGEW